MSNRILAAAILMFGASLVATAQAAPKEELASLTADLRKTPDDAALREKIIKHVREMKPQPAVPAEGRRPFIKGATFMKSAASVSDYDLAVQAFKEALLIAPWWPDALYNLAVAQEKAERYDDAIANLKLYLLTKPKDAQEAEDRMYALEAQKEKAAKDAAKAQQQAAQQEEAKKQDELGQRLSGAWMNRITGGFILNMTGKSDFTLKWAHDPDADHPMVKPYAEIYSGTVMDSRVSGTWTKRANYSFLNCGVIDFSGTFDGTVSADGRTIRLAVNGTNWASDGCATRNFKWEVEFTKQ